MRFAFGSGVGVCALLLLGLSACGDDDDGGASGVPGSTKVNELTAAQEKALCKEFNGKLASINDDIVNATCSANGIGTELANMGTCEEVRKNCLTETGETIEEEDCSMMDDDDDDACDATVGEYRACINALVKQSGDVFGNITCDSDPNELESLESPPLPSACQKLEDKCPGEVAAMEGGG